MNLSPTSDSRIFESAWFTNPNNPLIENKIFYAKTDNLMYYITAHRGPTTDNLESSPKEVKGVLLSDTEGREDNATDCFNMLVKYLNKPL